MKVLNRFENRPDEMEVVVSSPLDEGRRPVCVVLNEEHELKLLRGDALVHTFVCSPSALDELCVGWLLSEGYGARALEVSEDGHTAVAWGAAAVPAGPEPLPPREIAASTREMLALFDQASDKYSRSHGIHECVIKGDGWHILRTDIGRHNAIDKAVGAAVMAGYDLAGTVMFSSGRINEQTVKKAARCGVSCLMSKAVITRQALELAGTLGLKVLFSVKPDGCFTK